jgi:hypothetical protein
LAAALFEEETEAAPVFVEPACPLVSPRVRVSEPAAETQGAPLWAEPACQVASLRLNGLEQRATETQFQETEAAPLFTASARKSGTLEDDDSEGQPGETRKS